MLHAMVSCICNKPSYSRPLASTSHWTPAEGFFNQVFKRFKCSLGFSFMDSKIGCTGNEHPWAQGTTQRRMLHAMVSCISNKPSYGRPLASTSHCTPAEGLFFNQVFKRLKCSLGFSFTDSKIGSTGNDHQRQCHIRVFCYSLGLRALLKGACSMLWLVVFVTSLPTAGIWPQYHTVLQLRVFSTRFSSDSSAALDLASWIAKLDLQVMTINDSAT